MQVFHITITKEFDCTILAESHDEVDKALKAQHREIDCWNPPDWEWDIYANNDPRLPIDPGEFDMVILDGKIYSGQETGALGERIALAKAKAIEDRKQALALFPKLGVQKCEPSK